MAISLHLQYIKLNFRVIRKVFTLLLSHDCSQIKILIKSLSKENSLLTQIPTL